MVLLRLSLLLLLIPTLGFSQSKKFITIPVNVPSYTLEEAVTTWGNVWLYGPAIKDTAVWVYITQSVYWKRYGLDTIEYKFTVDSIRGRGDRREVCLARWFKSKDPNQWGVWWCDTSASWVKLYTTTDSSSVNKMWIRPKPTDGVNTLFPDGRSATWYPGSTWGTYWGADSTTLQISFDKVIGDPTVNQGLLQRALLRFKYYRYLNRLVYQ